MFLKKERKRRKAALTGLDRLSPQGRAGEEGHAAHA